MPYYTYNERDSKKRKIKITPCKKCKSTDIAINNCGYTTFNVGNVKCNRCKQEIKVDYVAWDTDGDIELLRRWNYLNSKKYIRDKIKSHEKNIKALNKELMKMI